MVVSLSFFTPPPGPPGGATAGRAKLNAPDGGARGIGPCNGGAKPFPTPAGLNMYGADVGGSGKDILCGGTAGNAAWRGGNDGVGVGADIGNVHPNPLLASSTPAAALHKAGKQGLIIISLCELTYGLMSVSMDIG